MSPGNFTSASIIDTKTDSLSSCRSFALKLDFVHPPDFLSGAAEGEVVFFLVVVAALEAGAAVFLDAMVASAVAECLDFVPFSGARCRPPDVVCAESVPPPADVVG